MSLDPAANRLAREEAAAAAAQAVPPLEPPFPWSAVPFPATAFVPPDPAPAAVDSTAASEIP